MSEVFGVDVTATSLEITAVIGMLAALGGAAVYTKRRIKRGIVKIKMWVDKLEAASDIVDAQLTKNGGDSLLDRIQEIRPNHEEAKEHWQQLHDADRLVRETINAQDIRFLHIEHEQSFLRRLVRALVMELHPDRKERYEQLLSELKEETGD